MMHSKMVSERGSKHHLKINNDCSNYSNKYIGLQKLKTAAKYIGTAEKQSARQVFVISDLFQNTIAYVMQL